MQNELAGDLGDEEILAAVILAYGLPPPGVSHINPGAVYFNEVTAMFYRMTEDLLRVQSLRRALYDKVGMRSPNLRDLRDYGHGFKL